VAQNKIGRQTIKFVNRPMITGMCSVVGKKESQGPLKDWFDVKLDDDTYGEKTWEKSESKMLKEAVMTAIKHSGTREDEIDVMLTGDLLNQVHLWRAIFIYRLSVFTVHAALCRRQCCLRV